MKRIIPGTIAVLLVTLTFSCVPKKKFNEMEALKNQVQSLLADKETEISSLNAQNAELIDSLKGLHADLASVKIERDGLLASTEDLTTTSKETQAELNILRASCDQLNDNYQQLKSKSSKKMKKLIDQLEALQGDLREREERLAEVQRTLRERDSTMDAIQQKVADALLGFKDEGLSVEVRGGKVYVSLSNKLLFASGSTKIDSKGQQALRDLAGVLKEQKDISIMVEGHTDNVPVSNLGDIQDNWDLSVMRSTAVVRILTEEGVEATRVIPSGRSEFLPQGNGRFLRSPGNQSPDRDHLISESGCAVSVDQRE